MRFPFEPPQEREFDAVGFGLNAVDHLVVVPAYPEFDTKTRLVEHTRSAGGQTASTMAGLRRLGMKTAYAGRFGSDDAGRFGLEALRAEGVNLERAETVEGARNQVGDSTLIFLFRTRDERQNCLRNRSVAIDDQRFGKLPRLGGERSHELTEAHCNLVPDLGCWVTGEFDATRMPAIAPVEQPIGGRSSPKKPHADGCA